MGLFQFLGLLIDIAKSSTSKSISFQGRDVRKLQDTPPSIPDQQQVLILHGVKQPYTHSNDHPIPALHGNRELLARNLIIGLNPIDWKAPDYNFGIPQLPYISGREFLGEIITQPNNKSRLNRGDRVIVISTDYRDLRKAAYQQYVVATDFNAARLPRNISPEAGSALGVAFVAAALSLGICAGLDFSGVVNGPDLLSLVQGLDPSRLPEDIRTECLHGIDKSSRAKQGDWVAVWGGSSTSAYMITQLARLAGLRTISVLDSKKHAGRLASASDAKTRPDVTVDSHDPSRAIDIVSATADGKLRFAIDTVGSTTAGHLLQCLARDPSPPEEHQGQPSAATKTAHLIGLTGLPKPPFPQHHASTTFHRVPIKVFHEIPELGEALMLWLERLLEQELLEPPRILAVEEGFGAVNGALDRMRRGEISGGRVVVRVG